MFTWFYLFICRYICILELPDSKNPRWDPGDPHQCHGAWFYLVFTWFYLFICRYICILELPDSKNPRRDPGDPHQWVEETRVQRIRLCRYVDLVLWPWHWSPTVTLNRGSFGFGINARKWSGPHIWVKIGLLNLAKLHFKFQPSYTSEISVPQQWRTQDLPDRGRYQLQRGSGYQPTNWSILQQNGMETIENWTGGASFTPSCIWQQECTPEGCDPPACT